MTRAVSFARDVADEDVIGAIQSWLARSHRNESVIGLRRRPWEYSTSAALELATAVFEDGAEHNLVLKHLSPRAMSENARRAKPSFVVDPQREIEVYRRLLTPLQLGPPLIGSSMAPHTATYWLLIEQVNARPLYEVGELETWVTVARWLGALHERFAVVDTEALRREARLLDYNREWYAAWIDRAVRFFPADDPARSRRSRTALDWLARRYNKVIERLIALPLTIIHGEFYPSNVLSGTRENPFVCPVDWEMTSIAPGIMDLAALTSGQWGDEDRQAMIAAYVDGSGARAGATVDAVAESLAFAHIHVAIQWLGWFGRRHPPAEHMHDWLSVAMNRAEALRL